MSAFRTYCLAGGLTLASVAAMGWSAIPPANGPGARPTLLAQGVIERATGWMRLGPAGGHPDWQEAAYAVQGADASNGPALMIAHGCGACHVIPGVTGARGTVGPALSGFRHRAYVAGILPNAPGNLVRWLMHPNVHAPDTAMPDLGVTEAEARDMAAYLYTIGSG